MAGAVSSLFILIIILKLGELFQDLPKVSHTHTHTHTQTGPGLRAGQVPGEIFGVRLELGVKGENLSESDPRGQAPGWAWVMPVRGVSRLRPQAVLAAIIIVNLKGMLLQFRDVCSLWRANRVDLVSPGPGRAGLPQRPAGPVTVSASSSSGW